MWSDSSILKKRIVKLLMKALSTSLALRILTHCKGALGSHSCSCAYKMASAKFPMALLATEIFASLHHPLVHVLNLVTTVTITT